MLRKILNDTLWYGFTLSAFAMVIFGPMIGLGLYASNGPKFAWKLAVGVLEIAWIVVAFAVGWIATRRIWRDSGDVSPSNSLTMVTLNGALGTGLPFLAVTLLCGWSTVTSSAPQFSATIIFFVWALVLSGAGALGSALYVWSDKRVVPARLTKIILIVTGTVVLTAILLFGIVFLGDMR